MSSLNIHQKMNEIQKKVKSVYKGSTVQVTQSSSYYAVSHDDVAALLHTPLAEAGIMVEVDMVDHKVEQIVTEKSYNGMTEKKYSYMASVLIAMTFVNSDNPTDRFTVKSFAYAFDSGDKAVGKAFSMAVKYVYLKNFNLESTDEEEQRTTEQENTYQQNRQDNSPRQEAPKQQQFETLASEAQMKFLTQLGVKYDKATLTKKAAGLLITEANNKGAR
jgi:hypothetical protein